jgi:hypothetical protein
MKNEFKIQIETAAGWQNLTCFTDSLTIERVKDNDNIYDRFNISGKIKAYGDGYNVLKTLAQYANFVNCRILQNGTFQVQGELNLKELTDEFFYFTENSFKVIDGYTKILDNKSIEINVLENTTAKTAITNFESDILTFQMFPFTDPLPTPIGSAFYNYQGQGTIYARQQKTVINWVYNIIIGTDGWTLLTDNGSTKTIVRDWTFANVATPDDTIVGEYEGITSPIGTRVINEIINFADLFDPQNIAYNSDKITHLYYFQFQQGDFYPIGIANKLLYKSSVTYVNCRSFYDCVEELITQISDNTVFLDNSNTATDSFYYLKNFESDDNFGEYPYANLLIQSVGDTILTETNELKSNPQTVLNWSFERLENFLKQSPLNIFWYIETRADGYYFVTKHLTEINKTTATNPDLTNYRGVDWTKNLKKYSYPTKNEYRILKRNGTYSLPDFVGTDIIYNNLNSTETKEITQSDFFVDLQYAFNNKSAFPDTSPTATFIFCADLISGNDYRLRTKLGKLSGDSVLNVELSLANLDSWFFAGAKDNQATINNININVYGSRLEKTKQAEGIKIPIFYLLQEFDFNFLVNFSLGEGEIQSIKKSANQNFAEIVLRFEKTPKFSNTFDSTETTFDIDTLTFDSL